MTHTSRTRSVLRAYRFDAQLFERFEADCARHLRNPRAVLEALVAHWLRADAKRRDMIAEEHVARHATHKSD
jgi:hypothetical protein